MLLSIRTKEFDALIRLLDDPDMDIYANVSSKLVSIGRNAIPLLEYEWESNANDDIQNRIGDIIHQIELDDCKKALKNWILNGAVSLMEGSFIVSSFQYPEQDVEMQKSLIEQIRKDIWLELNDNLTSLEKVRVINHIIYDVHTFSGNLKHKNAIQQMLLCNVLEHKKANPTSMAILYKIITDQLELPVVGLNLPYHLILGYVDVNGSTANDNLFYINPFGKGIVFGKGELERYMQRMEIERDVNDVHPLSNIQIISRQLNEMKKSYISTGQTVSSAEIDQLLDVIETNKCA